MRRWMFLAALLCPACATSPDPPEPEIGGGDGTTTTKAPHQGADGSACEAPGGCSHAPDPPDDGGGDHHGDTCREACADAVSESCELVAASCEAGKSIAVGSLKIPCVIAKAVACGASSSVPLVCEWLCLNG